MRGRALTSLMRLDDRVTLQVGDATSLEFGNGTFDAVWTQNSGMNIADKDQLYAELHRVLKPFGVLATQEPMAGPGGPRTYPLMWADDPVTDHLRTPAEMRAVIEDAGFRMLAWDEVRVDRSAAGTPPLRTRSSGWSWATSRSGGSCRLRRSTSVSGGR